MISVIQQSGEVVLQKVAKADGTLLRYQYGKPGDASTFIQVRTVEEGKEAIALPIATVVDRNGEAVARKVMKNGKLVRYEYSITGECFTPVGTLTEARKAIGK